MAGFLFDYTDRGIVSKDTVDNTEMKMKKDFYRLNDWWADFSKSVPDAPKIDDRSDDNFVWMNTCDVYEAYKAWAQARKHMPASHVVLGRFLNKKIEQRVRVREFYNRRWVYVFARNKLPAFAQKSVLDWLDI